MQNLIYFWIIVNIRGPRSKNSGKIHEKPLKTLQMVFNTRVKKVAPGQDLQKLFHVHS